MTCSQYFTLGGLGLDIIGALLLGRAFLVSRKVIADQSVSRWASDDPEENLKQPAAKKLLVDRSFGLAGTAFLFFGFVAQATAVFLK